MQIELPPAPRDRGPRALVGRLLQAREHLAPSLRRKLLALGDAAVPALVELVQDDALARQDAPGEGWAPVHAADLLGELRASPALEPLLAALLRTDVEDALHDRAISALHRLGAPVVEPTLRAHGATSDDDLRVSLENVLACAGVRDERIGVLLLARLERGDPLVACLLAEYGDVSALPALSGAIDRCPATEAWNTRLIELVDAVHRLGGRLTPSQVEQVRVAKERAEDRNVSLRAALGIQLPARRSDAPGRNDPCWCGAPRKYKKCHLAADAAPSG